MSHMQGDQSLRLFTAILLPSPVVQELAGLQQLLEKKIKGLTRKIPENNLHLTLNFIGGVASSRVDEIKQSLSEIMAGDTEIAFEELVFLKQGRNAGLIWVGIKENEAITLLEGAIAQSLLLPHERPYLPHITLFRLKNSRLGSLIRRTLPEISLSIPPFKVQGFSLMQSITKDTGVHYIELARF